MKKVLAISCSLLLGIVFLSGCGRQSVNQIQSTTPSSMVQTPAQSTVLQQSAILPVNETVAQHTYASEKFGFTLQFPKSWTGFEAGTEKDYPTYSNIGFVFRNGHQSFNIFSINKYTKKQWELEKKGTTQKILSQSNDITITCDGCCNEDSDFTGGGQFDEFQIERCKEVPQILSTFKLTK